MSIQSSKSDSVLETIGGLSFSQEFLAVATAIRDSLVLVTGVHANDVTNQTEIREGTGFCVDARGYFLTALHYLTEAETIYLVKGVDLIAATIVASDADLDLVLLKTVGADREFASLVFAEEALSVEDLVCGVGFAAGRLVVAPLAFLASYQGRFVDGVDPNQPGLSCPALPSAAWFIGESLALEGLSGGPLLNEAGLVVGITEMGDGENFVVGTTAGDAIRFIAAHI